MLKDQVKNCFDEAATTYDSVADIQKSSAKILADLIASDKISSVIDIGCGTGNASLELYEKYPNAEYTLCDISENMLKIATDKFPKKVRKICCDAENYAFDQHYDLGISNLSMQWFSEPKKFIEKIMRCCDSFAFSTLLDTSFESYKKLFELPPTFEYPSAEEILKIGHKRHLIKRFSLEFKNSFAVARYFKKLGACLKSHDCSTQAICKNAPIMLEYDILFVVI